MRATELIISAFAILVLLLADGTTARAWRPQGRFGKRTNSAVDQTRFTDSPASDIGLSSVVDIPVEIFASLKPAIRPRLCTISGVAGYPTCDRRNLLSSSAQFSSSSLGSPSSIKTIQDLMELLER